IDPMDAFRMWVDRFCTDFEAHHPPSVARKAALIIQREYRSDVSVGLLARRVHATPRRLSQAFRREYRMTILEYHRLTRLLGALERIRHEKVEAIALEIGYRSKKSLYRAFRQLTGLLPNEFRRLPPKQADEILEQL